MTVEIGLFLLACACGVTTLCVGVLVAYCEFVDWRKRRRARRERQARDESVAARLAEDREVADLEALFAIDMGYDPEALGS